MPYSVYQHWDPLRVCVVGRSYPPEFYNWIKVEHVRKLFEKIAEETEEDYQNIIAKLESFDVQVIRPAIAETNFLDGKYLPPPMTPRDDMVMIGNSFYANLDVPDVFFEKFYNDVRATSWPDCRSLNDFARLPDWIQQECMTLHDMATVFMPSDRIKQMYGNILEQIQQQGNSIRYNANPAINGAMVSRIGRDLYFGSFPHFGDMQEIENFLHQHFSHHRVHVIHTGGHTDGVFCPVTPGLIISLRDVPTYAETFPGWEVVYLPNQSWHHVRPFLDLKAQNRGHWWIPGFEYDQNVIDTVETWLQHWVGYVEETVFDVNMLIIDPKNVIVFNENDLVFEALDRYGITPHVVPFRHRYFWDGGIHCVTTDLHREGTMSDFFPDRSKNS